MTYLEEGFEDTKGVVKIRISKKNRQHNGQKKKYKRTNNDLLNIHIKLKLFAHSSLSRHYKTQIHIGMLA
jgi:hypothetical protein